MYKSGEKLVRYCKKERSSGYTTVHDYTIYSDVFEESLALPLHIKALFDHLRHSFVTGPVYREKSCSIQDQEFNLTIEEYETDLVAYAELSDYHGTGRMQHPTVQNYLHDWCPLTVASEIPVWDDEYCGFIDLIRIHKDFRIEIADFKPKAKREKKAHQQVWKYRELLMKSLNLPPSAVFCTYFDDSHGFIVKEGLEQK